MAAVEAVVSASSQLTGITLWISSPISPKLSVEIAASAKTIGARIRSTPPASVPIQLTKIAPIGITSRSAISIAP